MCGFVKALTVDSLQFLLDCRSLEVREHEFFKEIDWQLVYHRKYPPPLIPPRGEVNAADAFDIGSFDEEDTKYIKVRCPFHPPYFHSI